ncbi:ABC transporter permease subunit [Gordonia desulfuricans]|uniref:ABC transporter permease subunit n=1 Tax=Gordonia desulfuricans TaxID=89051 RepID=A0A7K3LKS4_9ACTN|nr:ABC transporter permease subunit [Gordonia desulfuricans]NDK88862.1 ABC transporter permease subunit [Gordonia desulfuricans]
MAVLATGTAPGLRIPRSLGTGLMVVPAVAFLVLFMVVPLVSFLVRSVTGDDGGFTWQYYAEIFTTANYRSALINSLLLAIGSTLITIVITVPAALHLARIDGKRAIGYDAVLTFPLSLPGLVIGFFVIILFGRAGLAQSASTALTGHPSFVLAYSMPGLLLAYLYFQLPRTLGILRGAAAALDPDAESVARTLGASPARITATVVLPALWPAILSAAGIAIASSLGAYGTVAALSEGFRVLPLEIAEQGTVLQNTALAGAMAIVLAVLSAVFTVINHLGERMIERSAVRA